MGDEAVGESEGRSRRDRIEKRLLILWCALAFVVWNGVYDMRMHDTVRGYLLETAEASAGLGRGVEIRTYLHRGFVDALAFSTAWSLGVFLAGLATMQTYRRFRAADLKVRPTNAGRGVSSGGDADRSLSSGIDVGRSLSSGADVGRSLSSGTDVG